MSTHRTSTFCHTLVRRSRRWTVIIRTTTTRYTHKIMASLKRSDSKTLKKDVPPRSCIACTDTDVPLIRPCRHCSTDYCEECLAGMFTAATDDFTRMPPRCCHFIQIHTVICHLLQDEVKAYRAKFEEWIAPVKFYCPSPKCSAFVPERRLPAPDSTPHRDATRSLSSILSEVVEAVVRDPSARFFRDEAPIDQLPGYSHVVTQPMYVPCLSTHQAPRSPDRQSFIRSGWRLALC